MRNAIAIIVHRFNLPSDQRSSSAAAGELGVSVWLGTVLPERSHGSDPAGAQSPVALEPDREWKTGGEHRGPIYIYIFYFYFFKRRRGTAGRPQRSQEQPPKPLPAPLPPRASCPCGAAPQSWPRPLGFGLEGCLLWARGGRGCVREQYTLKKNSNGRENSRSSKRRPGAPPPCRGEC